MIKGVNKRIIEINNTENVFIEKAILFINPKLNNINEKDILAQAKKYLGSVTYKNNTLTQISNKKKNNIYKKKQNKIKLINIKRKTLFQIIKLFTASFIGFLICMFIIK